MTKSNKKALAAIALTACMTTCASVALTRLANTAYAETAHTASVQTTQASETVIAEGLNITNGMSATATVGNMSGQYFAYVTIMSYTGEDPNPYNIFVTVGGKTVTLVYNYMIDKYEGVVKVTSGATLEVSTNSLNTFVVDVALGSLYLGTNNNYTINGVEIAAKSEVTVDVENAEASNYVITVDIGAAELSEGESLSVTINGMGYATDLEPNGGMYSAEITLSEDTTYLTIYSSSEQALNMNINLFKVAHYDKLPSSAELTMWETVTYEYTVEKDGYYSIAFSSDDAMAEVSTILKTEADAWEGLNVTGEDFPLYMAKGTTYYVDLVLVNASNEEATVNIAVAEWKNPKLMLNEIYYLPVVAGTTPATSAEYVESTLVAEKGTYNLALMNVPFMYYMANVTVTATIDGAKYKLSPENNYSIKVTTLADSVKVSLTTSDETSTVVGVSFAIPEVRNTMNLEEKTAIKVPAYETVAYYIEGITEGYYYIVLDGVPAGALLNVYTSESDVIVVPYGETRGGFQVRWGGDFAIIFSNNGDKELSFNATVYNEENEYILGLAKEQAISLNANTRTTYYMEGLAQGNYKITLSNANVSVWVNGEEVKLENGEGTFNLPSGQDYDIVTVSFKSASAVTFNVTVMPLDILELGVAKNLTADPWYYGTAYYILLNPGTYSVVLDLPEGLYGDVNANNESATNGLFTVTEKSYVAIKITLYSFVDEELDFRVLVNTYGNNTMTLGKEESVSLSNSNFGQVYKMSGLASGEYILTLSSDAIKVYVDGSLVEGNSFYVWGDSCTIAFIYSGEGSVTFTAKVTPANMLTLGETEITIDAWTYSKTYFLDLKKGEYEIYITLNGVPVQVVYNGEEIVAYGNDYGFFEVTADGYIILTFNVETFEEVTFTIDIS